MGAGVRQHYDEIQIEKVVMQLCIVALGSNPRAQTAPLLGGVIIDDFSEILVDADLALIDAGPRQAIQPLLEALQRKCDENPEAVAARKIADFLSGLGDRYSSVMITAFPRPPSPPPAS